MAHIILNVDIQKYIGITLSLWGGDVLPCILTYIDTLEWHVCLGIPYPKIYRHLAVVYMLLSYIDTVECVYVCEGRKHISALSFLWNLFRCNRCITLEACLVKKKEVMISLSNDTMFLWRASWYIEGSI